MGHRKLTTHVCRVCGDDLPESFFRSVKSRGYTCIRCDNIYQRYKVSHYDIEAMLFRQKNKCKICGEPINHHNRAIDHCHDSKIVRGLLCQQCNIGLGHFRDNQNHLKKAIKYLNESNAKKSKATKRARAPRRSS